MSFAVLFLVSALVGSVVNSGTRGASAEQCSDCHRAIYDSWQRSSHARAMESRSFRNALALAAGESGLGIRKTCLGCHAPLAVQAGDLGLERKASWEGVTCDYCHSVRDISISGRNPQPVLQIGMVKTGPLKDAVSSAHQNRRVTSTYVVADLHAVPRVPECTRVSGTDDRF